MPTTFSATSSIAHSVDGEYLLTIPDGAIGAAALADGAMTPQKLQKPNAYFEIPFDNVPSVPANSSETTIRARLILGVDATLVAVKGLCSAKAGATGPSFNVYKGANSVLAAAVTLSQADTVYSGGIATAAGATDDIYTLRAATAADGSISDLKVILVFKTGHAA